VAVENTFVAVPALPVRISSTSFKVAFLYSSLIELCRS
jgi:hypothetical protein